MATRVSSIFEQAQKEIRRLERAAKRIEKRGYVFDLPFGKTKTGKAKARYTRKDVEYLKSLKARNLYQYATAFGMSGEEYRAAERSRASKKGAETRKQNLNKPYDYDLEREKRDFEQYKQYKASISSTIVSNFLDISNFIYYGRGLSEDGYQAVVFFTNTAIADPEIGYDLFADTLEAHPEVKIDVQHSYDTNVRINLSKLGEALDKMKQEKEYQKLALLMNTSDSDGDDTGLHTMTPGELAEYLEIFKEQI